MKVAIVTSLCTLTVTLAACHIDSNDRHLDNPSASDASVPLHDIGWDDVGAPDGGVFSDTGEANDSDDARDNGNTQPDIGNDAGWDSGIPPVCIIKADPSHVDFGALAVGKKAIMGFRLLSVGEKTCHISEVRGPSDPHFRIPGIVDYQGLIISGAPFLLGPRTYVTVLVEATAPQYRTSVSSDITFINDSVNSPEHTVRVSIRGPDPGLCKFKVLPVSTLNFGNVAKGGKRTLGVNFENIGTDDCQITDARVGTLTGDWFTLVQYNYPINVQPGTTKKIEVGCAPDGTGPAPDLNGVPDPGTANVLNVSTTDPAQPWSSGRCPSPGWCHTLICTGVTSVLDVLPNPVDFGIATFGCNSAEAAVELFNNGTVDLNVSQLEVISVGNPPPFMISSAPPTPFAIGPRSSVYIKARYRPTGGKAETGTLRIHTDAPNTVNGLLDVSLRGEGTLAESVTDRFAQESRPKVDVLWCVDNSSGMGPHQQVLADRFMNHLEQLWIDYQVGVVTTEINEAGRGPTGDMIYPGVLFQRIGYPRIIANRPPPGAGPAYQPVNADRRAAFSANAMPGVCCSDERETCMEAVRLALSHPSIDDDQANKGFLRQGSTLVIAMLSDEDDQSPGTVEYYSSFLKGLKAGDPARLRLSIIAEFGGEGTGANPPTPKACGGNTGSGAVRYADLFQKIGSGLAEPICSTDWIDRIAGPTPLVSFVAVIEYYLSQRPDPASIVVVVNGSIVLESPVNGWSYDSYVNSIVFGSGAVPPEGAAIEVTYRAQCW